MAHLRVDIDGEDGSTIEPLIAAGETLSEVSYVSKCAGVFTITTHWGEHELLGSPFTMYSIDPLKFSLKEALPKCSPVGEPLQFFYPDKQSHSRVGATLGDCKTDTPATGVQEKSGG